jgi:hypothetical protein
MTTSDVAPDLGTRRRLGWAFLAAAGIWVLYIALAVSFAADYETALEDASDALDTPVNKLPAETLAEITQDHPGSIVTAVVLLFAPVLLIVVAHRTRAITSDPWALRLAWLSGIVLWFYFLLNAGLYFDPQDLPPLTRDLDVLTVPLVSIGSVLALLAFIAAAWSLRRHGTRRVASTVAAVLAAVLLALSVVGSISTGWDDPVPPIGLFPVEVILGIALIVGTRQRGAGD